MAHVLDKERFWPKIAIFFMLPSTLHSMLPSGGPCRNVAILFGTGKLEWCGPTVKKFEDM